MIPGLFKDFLDMYDPLFYMGGIAATVGCLTFAAYVHFHMPDRGELGNHGNKESLLHDAEQEPPNLAAEKCWKKMT